MEAFDEKGKRLQLSARAIAGLGLGLGQPKSSGNGVLIPYDAVVMVQGQPFVYLAQAERWFKRHSIKTGLRRGKDIEVVSGLVPKQSVVVLGAFYVRTVELDLLAGDEAGHGH